MKSVVTESVLPALTSSDCLLKHLPIAEKLRALRKKFKENRVPPTLLKSLAIVLTAAGCSTLLGGQTCHCPNPPGGGVTCGAGQIAICDPSSGICACSCETIAKGHTKTEYLATLFSKFLGTDITPRDVESKYAMQRSLFLASGEANKKHPDRATSAACLVVGDCQYYVSFYFRKTATNGNEVMVNVSIPEWLANELLEKKNSPWPD